MIEKVRRVEEERGEGTKGVLWRSWEQEHATQSGMNGWCKGMYGNTSPHIGMARKQ